MPSDVSAILSLPYLQPAQAQKHVTHNEALRQLDLLVQLAVASRQAAVPPADPAAGLRLIVPAGATGAFAGRDGAIALWDDGEWHFTTPLPGWRAEVLDEGCAVVFDGTAWRGPEVTAGRFASLGVAAEADATNRLAVAGPATLMTHAGAGHQLKINKATAGDTGSVVFQTGWSGRAEIGTTGSDDLAVRVSPDGTAWSDALVAEAASGMVRLPAGLRLPDGNALAPPLAFAADADTGLYRAGADALALAAGGAERARVTSSGLQVTGQITGTAVTQSASDSTTGRLLRVGDFSLGRLAANPVGVPGGNVDAFTIPNGWYWINNTNAGTLPPDTAGMYAILQNWWRADNSIFQMAIQRLFSPDRVVVWLRNSTGNPPSGWMPWRRLYSQSDILGTVSESGGVPTGAVIERGSNANGEYVRFADGTQICSQRLTDIAIDNSFGSGGLFRSNTFSWTFPAAFVTGSVNGANLFGRVGNASGMCVHIPYGNRTTQAIDIRAFATSSVASTDVFLTATGRWF
jgi:hypothetical protein